MVDLGESGGEGWQCHSPQCFRFLAAGVVWVRVRGRCGVGGWGRVIGEFEVLEVVEGLRWEAHSGQGGS